MNFKTWSGLLIGLCACHGLGAATYTVTKTADTLDGACDADCSLREAIAAANASAEADTIVLKATTYRITRPTPQTSSQDDAWFDEDDNAVGDFDITSGELLIKGRPGTVIDGGDTERIFELLPLTKVEMRDLELKRGYTAHLGGAINNEGDLRLTRARLRFNRAASGFNLGRGGAIYNGGILSMADSHFLDNAASGGEASSGEGGAIFNTTRLNIRTTRFIGNVTSDDNDIGGGGAIMNRGGFVTIDRAFFQRNSTSSNGYGGAIANRDGGRLVMVNATVTGNSSGEATGGGGAIANGTRHEDRLGTGTLLLRFVTVADNDGGGLYNNGDATLEGSIIAGNYENFGSNDVRHYDTGINCVNDYVLGHTATILASDDHSCGPHLVVANPDAMNLLLHPLNNNGGFAPTHALREFEPAFDSADGLEHGCPSVDQRGAMRPADGNADGVPGCDIGAFERNDDD